MIWHIWIINIKFQCFKYNNITLILNVISATIINECHMFFYVQIEIQIDKCNSTPSIIDFVGRPID